MPESVPILTPFADYMVGDEAFAEAYEALGAVRRAGLKRCIAVLYESFGETPVRETVRRAFRQGFILEDDDAGPAPYVIIVCDAFYPCAEGLLAALMPALAAGARPHLLFRDSKGGVAHPLLTALELAGVEEAWLLDDARIQDFFRAATGPATETASAGACAAANMPPGMLDGAPDRTPRLHAGAEARLALLGEEAFGEGLILEAHRRGALCRSLFGLPPEARRAREAAATPAAHGPVLFWPHLEPGWFRLRTRAFHT